MSEALLTPAQVKARLASAVKLAGGVNLFARRHGISASYVSEAMTQAKEIGPGILATLGVMKVERLINVRRGSNGGPDAE